MDRSPVWTARPWITLVAQGILNKHLTNGSVLTATQTSPHDENRFLKVTPQPLYSILFEARGKQHRFAYPDTA
jgi:hypothetical protein